MKEKFVMYSAIIFLALAITCAEDPEKELSTTQDYAAPAGGNSVTVSNASVEIQKYIDAEVLLCKNLDEICEKEKNYLDLLNLFIEAYMEPFAKYHVHAIQAEKDDFFVNIVSIFKFNSTEFLNVLITEWEKEKETAKKEARSPVVPIKVVCQAFSSIQQGNKYENLYSRYAQKYVTALALSKTQTWLDYFKFLENKEKWGQVQKRQAQMNSPYISVDGYLILPVQQGPRYPLLLKDFIKYADPTKRKKEISSQDLELYKGLLETQKVVLAVIDASNKRMPLSDVFSEKEISEMGKLLYYQKVEFSRRIKYNFSGVQPKHPALFYVLDSAIVFIKTDIESKAKHYSLPVAKVNYGELQDELVLTDCSGWPTHIYNITAPIGMKPGDWNVKIAEIKTCFERTVPSVLNEAAKKTLQQHREIFQFHSNQPTATKNVPSNFV